MTPWGAAQHREKFDTGFNFYSTAGHGGICVSKKKAETFLSDAARKVAIRYGNGHWFEEDCNFAIPLYENTDWLKLFNKNLRKPITVKDLERMIQQYNEEYWISRMQEYHEEMKNIGDAYTPNY